MAIGTNLRATYFQAPAALLAVLVCLPAVGIAGTLPDTSANRARGVVGCYQTSTGTYCPGGSRQSSRSRRTSETPVYTPPPQPGPDLRQYGQRVLRRLANTDISGAGSGLVISGSSSFSTLASIADAALQLAMTLKNRYYARWWSAKDNLNAWQNISRQVDTVAVPLIRAEAEHETVLQGALKELDERETQQEAMVVVLGESRDTYDEMFKQSREKRLQFYQTATRLNADLPPPSAFVRVPDPISPYYQKSNPSVSVGHRPPDYIGLLSAIANPDLVSLSARANDSIQPAAADDYSVRQQFGKVESTLEQARMAKAHARLSEEDVDQAARNANAGFEVMNKIPGRIEKLRDRILDTRQRIAHKKLSMPEIKQLIIHTDGKVIAKAVEAAAWSSIEKRMIRFAEKRTGLTGVVGRVNTVNTVMNDAAELGRGVLGIVSEVPAAVIMDPERIPVLQEELSQIVGQFTRRLYGSVSGIPSWAVTVFEPYLEKRVWREPD